MRNKENLNRWQKEYYEKKKDDLGYLTIKRKSARKYYNNNKEKFAIKSRAYRSKNIEKYRKYRREYRWNNPLGIYSVIELGAKRRGMVMGINKNDFSNWYINQEKICFYCGRTVEMVDEKNDFFAKRSKRLTVDRTDNSQGYSIGNIVLCCYRCNSIKGDFFTKDEMIEIGKIIRKKV